MCFELFCDICLSCKPVPYRLYARDSHEYDEFTYTTEDVLDEIKIANFRKRTYRAI